MKEITLILCFSSICAQMHHATTFLPYYYQGSQVFTPVYSSPTVSYIRPYYNYGRVLPYVTFAQSQALSSKNNLPKPKSKTKAKQINTRDLLLSHVFNKYQSNYDFIKTSTKVCPGGDSVNFSSKNTFKADCVTYFDTHLNLPSEQGQNVCKKYGLNLASARTKDENDVLSENAVHAWIDGVRRHTGAVSWLWRSDRTPIICPFWHQPFEPNNLNRNENCIEMSYYGAWKDVNCNTPKRVICEQRRCQKTCQNVDDKVWLPRIDQLPKIPKVFDKNAQNKVDFHKRYGLTNYFKGMGTNCVTYFNTNVLLPYQQANKFCQEKGLNLATSRSIAENNLLGYNKASSNYGTWIGGIRTGIDGIEFYDGKCSQCHFWDVANKEPAPLNSGYNCVMNDKCGRWQSAPCGTIRNVVCEYRTCTPSCREKYKSPKRYDYFKKYLN